MLKMNKVKLLCLKEYHIQNLTNILVLDVMDDKIFYIQAKGMIVLATISDQ